MGTQATPPPALAQEIIRIKRDGQALAQADIEAFVQGLVDASWSESQAAALAMAIYLNGMTPAETIALTHAMARSGEVLSWADAQLPGPILDKHSTGGVGDKVSLPLAPIVAACGGYVPMISGRGLGHTGGTLDKLDSIPGYRSTPPVEQLRAALQTAGCAIVGQTARLAPADRTLYAIRDVTATVESLPLITASILSKKLAAGLHGLVMDVKTGNGAFAAERAQAETLAQSLVDVAQGAGLPTRAWITDMNQVLGHSCGNALEVHEAVALLRGEPCEPRLLEITRQLGAEMLLLGRLAASTDEALARIDAALASGQALERFARMVSALGGPADFVERPGHYLPAAPEQLVVRAAHDGWVARMHTREIGLLVIDLGGGRRQAADGVDPRVGFSEVAPIGRRVARGDVLARVHAATPDAAQAAAAGLARLIEVDQAPAAARPVMLQRSAD